MLYIEHPARKIPKREYFDNRTQEFVTIEEQDLGPVNLKLEHSLMSIAKWESKWHESFMGVDVLNGERLQDYIRCMTVNPQKDKTVYDRLTEEDLERIIEYMDDPNSAWEIRKNKNQNNKKKNRPITVEEIYYAMIQYGIPPEYEQWHFNRLVALIDYFDSKGGSVPGGGSPKKRSEREIMEMYKAINERNRKKYNSKG